MAMQNSLYNHHMKIIDLPRSAWRTAPNTDYSKWLMALIGLFCLAILAELSLTGVVENVTEIVTTSVTVFTTGVFLSLLPEILAPA